MVKLASDQNDDFGYSVSMDGRTIVVGAHIWQAGSAYVFTYDGERGPKRSS